MNTGTRARCTLSILDLHTDVSEYLRNSSHCPTQGPPRLSARLSAACNLVLPVALTTGDAIWIDMSYDLISHARPFQKKCFVRIRLFTNAVFYMYSISLYAPRTSLTEDVLYSTAENVCSYLTRARTPLLLRGGRTAKRSLCS